MLGSAETISASVNFDKQSPHTKERGAVLTRTPHDKLLTTTRSVSAVWSGAIGDGPSSILRARHDLIEEAALMIFSDYLDTWTITTCVDRDRPAIR